jgi:G3E family GTPase
MQTRTPLTLITGPLGSGKTTLLRHLLNTISQKIAILMNEFGEIAIDNPNHGREKRTHGGTRWWLRLLFPGG